MRAWPVDKTGWHGKMLANMEQVHASIAGQECQAMMQCYAEQ